MDIKKILNILDDTKSVHDMKKIDLEKSDVNQKPNPTDTVTIDIPLLIRLLEFSREDAKSDIDLHNIAEALIELGKDGHTLSMAHYDNIVSSVDSSDKSPIEKHPYSEGLSFLNYLALVEKH